MKLLAYILVFFSILIFFPAYARQDSAAIDRFLQLEEEASKYSTISMFNESAAKWTEAISWAEENNLDRQVLDAKISLAEMLRKIGDFNQAMEILNKLNQTKKYPALHVRKLGRKAAIIHEDPALHDQSKVDTIKAFIQKALDMAVEFGLKSDEASLKNELGFLMIRNNQVREGLEYLFDASEIFYSIGDTLNYIFAMTHVADAYHQLELTEKEDSISRSLVKILDGTKWYTAKIDLYQIIAHSALKKKDSSKYYRFIQKKEAALVSHVKSINNNKLSALRILYSTERYQQEAIRSENIANIKAKELEQQKVRTRGLTIFISILASLILLIAFLFIREMRLKKQMDDINTQLKVANDKYHMLSLESNHRIKNNLQMVISMLQYTKNDLETNSENYINRISSKIHTISALHKHLYMDVHNERVSIKNYFNEVIWLYKEIADNKFNVKSEILSVKIKSERLVYFGLILNEMLTNTLKHNKQKEKVVNIKVQKVGNQYCYEYYDNSNIQLAGPDSKGVGTQLINQLIKRIGGKNYEFTPSQGMYKFYFDE